MTKTAIFHSHHKRKTRKTEPTKPPLTQPPAKFHPRTNLHLLRRQHPPRLPRRLLARQLRRRLPAALHPRLLDHPIPHFLAAKLLRRARREHDFCDDGHGGCGGCFGECEWGYGAGCGDDYVEGCAGACYGCCWGRVIQRWGGGVGDVWEGRSECGLCYAYCGRLRYKRCCACGWSVVSTKSPSPIFQNSTPPRAYALQSKRRDVADQAYNLYYTIPC